MGLADRADAPTVNLSHGEHRLMEIAIALASEAPLMLLDEPMAGLGPEESAQMVAFLKGLKGRATVPARARGRGLLLADSIGVLVTGHTIANVVRRRSVAPPRAPPTWATRWTMLKVCD
ncbi:MAG: ATP-binding cassette domain-containing protein [Paracoccaceae bacterium]